jgi:hypothetical protein
MNTRKNPRSWRKTSHTSLFNQLTAQEALRAKSIAYEAAKAVIG